MYTDRSETGRCQAACATTLYADKARECAQRLGKRSQRTSFVLWQDDFIKLYMNEPAKRTRSSELVRVRGCASGRWPTSERCAPTAAVSESASLQTLGARLEQPLQWSTVRMPPKFCQRRNPPNRRTSNRTLADHLWGGTPWLVSPQLRKTHGSFQSQASLTVFLSIVGAHAEVAVCLGARRQKDDPAWRGLALEKSLVYTRLTRAKEQNTEHISLWRIFATKWCLHLEALMLKPGRLWACRGSRRLRCHSWSISGHLLWTRVVRTCENIIQANFQSRPWWMYQPEIPWLFWCGQWRPLPVWTARFGGWRASSGQNELATGRGSSGAHGRFLFRGIEVASLSRMESRKNPTDAGPDPAIWSALRVDNLTVPWHLWCQGCNYSSACDGLHVCGDLGRASLAQRSVHCSHGCRRPELRGRGVDWRCF